MLRLLPANAGHGSLRVRFYGTCMYVYIYLRKMTIHDGLGGGLGSATVVLVARRIRSRAPVLIEHEEGRGSVAVVVELGPVEAHSHQS